MSTEGVIEYIKRISKIYKFERKGRKAEIRLRTGRRRREEEGKNTTKTRFRR
jgi:hypothetical protein